MIAMTSPIYVVSVAEMVHLANVRYAIPIPTVVNAAVMIELVLHMDSIIVSLNLSNVKHVGM